MVGNLRLKVASVKALVAAAANDQIALKIGMRLNYLKSQVEVVGSAAESEASLRLCAELRPDAVFVDINLPGKRRCFTGDATAMLPQPPRLVFTTGSQLRAMRGEDTKRNFKHTKRQSSSETTHVVQATIGHLR